MTRVLAYTIIFIALIQASCRKSVVLKSTTAQKEPIESILEESSLLHNSFTGLIIQEAESGEVLFESNAHKYFVPASNTKAFTLYASLHTLKDKIPSLEYIETDSSFIFWGTGDPTFLHPSFPHNRTLDFLKSQKKKLVFSGNNFFQEAYGDGWMWSDYNEYYQVENTSFPMYGNTVEVYLEDETIRTQPAIFESTTFDTLSSNTNIVRSQWANTFTIPSDTFSYRQEIPFKTSNMLAQQLLIDTLNREVELSDLPKPSGTTVFYGQETQPVLKKMMKESDNFLAEQLLLLSSLAFADSLNSSIARREISHTYLKMSPQPLKWVDGSGLSRYNLFTPSSIAYMLYLARKEFGEERLYPLLAQNSQAGTLRSIVSNDNEVFLYGKSGSMSGVYNLCGYIKASSGKTLIVSCMHNNFNGSVISFRKWTAKLFNTIKSTY